MCSIFLQPQSSSVYSGIIKLEKWNMALDWFIWFCLEGRVLVLEMIHLSE